MVKQAAQEAGRDEETTAGELPEDAELQEQVVGVMEGFDFLRRIPLFEDMPLAQMKSFYNICEERVFDPDSVYRQ